MSSPSRLQYYQYVYCTVFVDIRVKYILYIQNINTVYILVQSCRFVWVLARDSTTVQYCTRVVAWPSRPPKSCLCTRLTQLYEFTTIIYRYSTRRTSDNLIPIPNHPIRILRSAISSPLRSAPQRNTPRLRLRRRPSAFASPVRVACQWPNAKSSLQLMVTYK